MLARKAQTVSRLCSVHLILEMMRALPVLLVVCLLLARKAQMNGLHERSHFLSASVGDNITLPCFQRDMLELGVKVYWYKQSLGMKAMLVSNSSKFYKINTFHGEFNSSKRFTLGHEENNLHIKQVQRSDSAVYLCLIGIYNQIYVVESFTVIIKSLNIQAKVQQPPHEDTEEGRSVILNCSVHMGGECEGQRSVHWFKQSEESAAGVLYSRGGGGDGDQCQKTTKSPTKSCVYSLHIHNVSSEQTGTYYCAVAACGQVLFGNGTEVKIKDGALVYVLSGVTAFTSSLVVGLTFCLCFKNNTDASKRNSTAKIKGFPKMLQFVATEHVAMNRGQRDDTWSECVYFSAKPGN